MRFERVFGGLMRVCVFGGILGGFEEVFYCFFAKSVFWGVLGLLLLVGLFCGVFGFCVGVGVAGIAGVSTFSTAVDKIFALSHFVLPFYFEPPTP
jgi:hypothetical protein